MTRPAAPRGRRYREPDPPEPEEYNDDDYDYEDDGTVSVLTGRHARDFLARMFGDPRQAEPEPEPEPEPDPPTDRRHRFFR